MQKIERFVKQTVWISEMDGSEHLTERQCKLHEKYKCVKKLVEKLHEWKFWENYDIAPIEFGGFLIDNLGFLNLGLHPTTGSFNLIPAHKNTVSKETRHLWCKVSLRGNKMRLLLHTESNATNPEDWKFLGEVDLRQVYDETSAKYYNATRTARIARQYENKQIQRRSGLSKLTQEEKKALNLI